MKIERTLKARGLPSATLDHLLGGHLGHQEGYSQSSSDGKELCKLDYIPSQRGFLPEDAFPWRKNLPKGRRVLPFQAWVGIIELTPTLPILPRGKWTSERLRHLVPYALTASARVLLDQ